MRRSCPSTTSSGRFASSTSGAAAAWWHRRATAIRSPWSPAPSGSGRPSSTGSASIPASSGEATPGTCSSRWARSSPSWAPPESSRRCPRICRRCAICSRPSGTRRSRGSRTSHCRSRSHPCRRRARSARPAWTISCAMRRWIPPYPAAGSARYRPCKIGRTSSMGSPSRPTRGWRPTYCSATSPGTVGARSSPSAERRSGSIGEPTPESCSRSWCGSPVRPARWL